MKYHAPLKARQRAERDGYPENVALRIHRALSWLDRAEQCEDDDGRFVFLWIAFNAAYANEMNHMPRFTQQRQFLHFIRRLVKLDTDDVLYTLVWEEFSGSVRLLLDNEYVFGPFWDFRNGRISEDEWKKRFRQARGSAHRAVGRHDTAGVLSIIFGRLYVLRNQVIHGGATWNSSVNRNQLRDAANFLGKLVPQVITLLMDHPEKFPGEACYPVVR